MAENDIEPDAPETGSEETQDPHRRDFLRAAVVVAGGAAIGLAAAGVAKLRRSDPPTGPKTIRSLPVLSSVPRGEHTDLLVRMQDELRVAMAKPVEERRWMMIIDTRKCVGCHACTVACIAENHLPPGVVYRTVMQEEIGTYPNVQLRFVPRPCMQCDEPPCVPVCPVAATHKRPDGVVAIEYDKCIGCAYCVTACPYNARTRDLGDQYTDGTPSMQPYEQQVSYEYGKAWDRADHGSPVGNARKCHFCLHRLEEGQLPECVTTCIGRATYFGDANDPDSLVSRLSVSPNAIRLLEEQGTKPRVLYLV